MKIGKKTTIILMLMITILAITAFAQTSEAKSLYVIANINDSPTPIMAYDILPNGTIQYQTTHDVPYHPYGAVGIAIDSDSEMLFVTYEDNNVIELISATNMTSLGITTAESANNLAGIVVDHGKSKVYTIDRNTNDLYVYDWNPANTTLYNEMMLELPNVVGAHGIALDEYNDLLFVGDRTTTVRYFHTSDWSEAGNFTVSQDAMGIAIDTTNNYVYTGNAYPGYGSIGILSKYDLNTDTETTFDLRSYTGDSNDNVVGLAVDQNTQKLYITTGNQGSGGSDKIIAFQSDFTVIDESIDIGDPTGLTIPIKDVSYNPLNLDKNDGLDEGSCVEPGESFTYTITFDNYMNDEDVHNVTIIDELPDEVTYVSSTDFGSYDSSEHTVTWDVGTVTPEVYYGVHVTVQVKATTPAETTFTNYVTIDGDETPPTTQIEETTTCEASGDDTTEPTQTVELGTPLMEDIYYTGKEWLDLIGSQTPVWINSTDDESGTDFIKYKLFKSDNFGDWDNPPWVEVYDNDDTGNPFTTDADPTVGRISIMFTIQESCFHQIHAHCVDNVGNWNNSPPLDFLVDFDAPSNDEFVYIGDYLLPGGARYINNQTIKRIWANDTGCTGGVAGVNRIEWSIENGDTVTIASGIVYDNDATVYEDEYVIVSGDLEMIPGKMIIEISLKEECIHFIYHQAIDNLENKVDGKKQLEYVDLTPPVITKTVGEPNCEVIPNKEYCITPDTTITFNAEDEGCMDGVGMDVLLYRIWNMTHGWTSWYEADGETVIIIDEECTHYLEIKAIDLLGNMVIDNETFHVDLQPPSIIKTVNDPYCGPFWQGPDMIPREYVKYFDDGAEAYCVTTNTTINLDAIDNGCCSSSLTIEYKQWKADEDEPGSWTLFTGNFSFAEECKHFLLVRAYDCLENGKEEINYWDLEIFYVDDSAPEIYKTVGDPNCTIVPGEEYCITSDTPIYIDAENNGCCPSEILMLRYKINEDDWVTPMLPAIIYFPDECTHTLTIEAWDCLGNTATDVETFHVDNSHPVLNKTVGEPNCPQSIDCTMLTIPETNVYVDFTYIGTFAYFDVHLTDVPMGYDIISGYYRGWCVDEELIYSDGFAKLYCSYDSEMPWPDDDWDKVNYIINHKHPNATVMEVQQAIWKFIDGGEDPPTPIGQSMVDDANMYGEGFMPHEGQYCAILMDTGDDSQKTFIEFRIPEVYCVTTSTEITLDGMDYPDCCPEDVMIEYKMWMANEPVPETWMTYSAPFTFAEECKHYLLVRVSDCLGHGIDDPIWDLEIFYVDDQAPEIYKTVGDPNCTIVPGEEYCIKTTTPITINAANLGCCIDDELMLRYKINDDEWIYIEEYPMTIYIEEECNHTLTIEASDCLGNTATDVELFHVDDTPPIINKIVGDPHCGPEWVSSEYIPASYARIFPDGVEAYCVNLSTLITLDILPDGSCCSSDITIEYKIWNASEFEPKMWTTYTEPFTFTEECKHYLLIRAYDCLENGKYNVSYYDLEIFYVDEQGPSIYKQVGDPKVYLGTDSHGHDQWMIYPYTDICLSIDPKVPEGCCPNETGTIEYRYWYLGEWTEWMTYSECIHLTEGCVHYLEARAIDCLGNIGPIDNETFWVCGPSGDSGPTIKFMQPLFGETICDRTLEVIIDASDDETEKEDLLVYLWIPSGMYGPTQYYPVEYNPGKYGDEFFHAFIDIYKYQDGTPLSIQAVAIDEDMNMEDTIELPFYVCSTTVYDQWMRKGWNQLIIPLDGISCSGEVEHVLASIHEYVDGVFYYDGSSWSSFIPGEPWNPWTEMETGKTYWIYINKAEGIRYYTDTHAPTVSILTPLNEETINDTALPYVISGEAMDVETGVAEVLISIYDNVTSEYWNGSDWTMSESWISCCGTESWYHNFSIMIATGHMDHQLFLTAKAYDHAGCYDMDTIWFMIEEEICEECPEGSGATIVPDYLEVSMYPGQTIYEIKNITTDEIPIGKLDVMFLFDLTGSMSSELSTAKTNAISIMNDIASRVNDSSFGVGSFMDYPQYYSYCDYSGTYGYTYGDYPWNLDQDITLSTLLVDSAINSLSLGSGADGPESYTRALWESQFASWRVGARKVVIIFGDNIPHDCNLGSYYGSEYSTGVDPGRDATAGTLDDLSWDGTAADLKNNGISVIAVNTYYTGHSYQKVWEYMTNETGGIYTQYGSASELPDIIVSSIGNVTATINHMTLQPSAGYEDWFDWTPEYHEFIPGAASVEFDVDITVPEDAELGGHHICLLVMGDGAILAVQELDITVLEGTPETYSITGDVYSESRLCGEYAYICLFNDTYYTSEGEIEPIECYSLPLGDVAFGESLGSYLFEDLDEGTYYITAFMDCNENLTFDLWEPAAAAVNQSWWPDAIILDGSNVTDQDVTFYTPDPSMTIEKMVWDDSLGDWMDSINAEMGETVTFQVTFDNTGNTPLLVEYIIDQLPSGLEYISDSTRGWAYFGDELIYHYNASEIEPDVDSSGDDYTLLSWFIGGESVGYPNIKGVVQFNATVNAYGSFMNMINCSVWYDETNYVYEDNTTVICEEPMVSYSIDKYTWYWYYEKWDAAYAFARQPDNYASFKIVFESTGDSMMDGDIYIKDELPENLTFDGNYTVTKPAGLTLTASYFDPATHAMYYNFTGTMEKGEQIVIIVNASYTGEFDEMYSEINKAIVSTSIADTPILSDEVPIHYNWWITGDAEPVEDADVNMEWQNNSHYGDNYTSTDSLGYYEMNRPGIHYGEWDQLDTMYMISNGFGETLYLSNETEILYDQPCEQWQNFTLYKPSDAATIQGHVYEKGTTNPIETTVNIYIENDIFSYDGSNSTESDTSGYYEINLPPSDVVLNANAPGYYMNGTSVTIGSELMTNVNIYLEPEPEENSIVKGYVTNRYTDESIEDASLYFFQSDSPYVQLDFTNESGYFEAPIAAGEFTVMISADDYVTNYTTFDIGDSETKWFNVSIIPYTSVIKGYVTNDSDETAIEDADVDVSSGLGSEYLIWTYQYTDEFGYFEIPVPAGNFTMDVWAYGYLNHYEGTFMNPLVQLEENQSLWVNISLIQFPADNAWVHLYINDSMTSSPIEDVDVLLDGEIKLNVDGFSDGVYDEGEFFSSTVNYNAMEGYYNISVPAVVHENTTTYEINVSMIYDIDADKMGYYSNMISVDRIIEPGDIIVAEMMLDPLALEPCLVKGYVYVEEL